jgi:hypothetical protein
MEGEARGPAGAKCKEELKEADRVGHRKEAGMFKKCETV